MAQGLFNLKQQLQGLIQKAWTGSIATNYVEYLVVAGGGAGGRYGAGGGAGGLLQGISNVTAGTSLTVTVGAGGAINGSSQSPGFSGANSVFGAITATGGGGGGSSQNGSNGSNGISGGSGGGGAWGANSVLGSNTYGQGNAGGTGDSGTSYGDCAGGGGAGTVGLNAFAGSAAGNGGAGISSAISGTVTAYAGGGGGASGTSSHTQGVGGVGGGGAGSYSSTGTAGTANTGGGGGGAVNQNSGSGGSGIVIISYPDTYNAPASFGGANSPTASTSGSGSFYNAGAGALGYSGTTPYNFTGNFTIEGWYNLANFSNASAGGNPGLIGYGTANWVLVIPGGAYNFYIGGSVVASSSAVASANVWNHFAVVRNGSTVTIYHNGTSVATGTNSSTISIGSNGITVGANGNGGIGSVTGYMSNVRIVNGTAVYTSNFTPTTAPLTAITNTSLLVNTVSGAYTADSSSYGTAANSNTTGISWNQSSPFATGLGYKNRVYTWTGSGTVTF